MILSEVKWGMIGCGVVTEKKSGPALYKSNNSKLIGVFDTNLDVAKNYARNHNVSKVFEDVEELFKDKDIDAVYIATPPNFHKFYALKALESGKIPLVEKPLALTEADALEIYKKSQEINLPVYVSYYRRSMEKYKRIKDIIDKGLLGEIKFVTIKHYMKPEPSDLDREKLPWRLIPKITLGGKFVDMATHVIDITEFLFGKIIEVNGFATNIKSLYDVEDTVIAVFKYANGAIASGNWCYVADYDEEKLVIMGEKGRIETTGLFNGPLHLFLNEEEKIEHFTEPEHVAGPYIQDIVNDILGLGPCPSDIESAINNIKVADDILFEYRKRYNK